MFDYLTAVERALSHLKAGKPIILTDHPDREDEGDWIMPAEKITPEIINLMIREGSGIICLPLLPEQLKKLNLPLMVAKEANSSRYKTPFTLSIDAKLDIKTGVSALDRVKTILTAINLTAQPEDLVSPGHVFPLNVDPDGVLKRPGHTEGAVDLVKLAGFQPAAVLCEVMNSDGTMARGEKLQAIAQKHNTIILSIAELIDYRLYHESLIIDPIIQTVLPTQHYGLFNLFAFREKFSHHEHIVLENNNINNKNNNNILVRIHSCCLTGDLFQSLRCDCHDQLHYTLNRLSIEGGLLIYLQQEGRGIGLYNKIKAYTLQDAGVDTLQANRALGFPEDARNYAVAAHFLRDYIKNKNINKIRLLTNNPEKINTLIKYGIKHVTLEPMPEFTHSTNQGYLNTKKDYFKKIKKITDGF